MGHLLNSVHASDVVQGINAGRQSTVKTEDLVVDEGREREEVEDVGKVFPDIRVSVFSQALVVEAVDLRDLPRLVVSSQDRDALWVSNLESNK